MLDTYVRQKADYDEIIEHIAHYGEEQDAGDAASDENTNTDDQEHSIDEWYEYLTYWTSSSQENPPTSEPALTLENPLAPDGSLLPPIQEGQNEDGNDDDYLGYYANYLTESYDVSDAIIPPIVALECASHRAELQPPFD